MMTIDAPEKRKPGRPRKITPELLQELENEEEVMQKNDHPKAIEMPDLKFKIIVRGIALNDGAGGIEGEVPAYVLETHASQFLAKGWKLFNTHYLGDNANAHMLMLILVKD